MLSHVSKASAGERDDESQVVAQLQKQLHFLLESYACNICHATLAAPVELTCKHMFCSECIRRHLLTHSVCPHPHCDKGATALEITALRALDAALEQVRRAAPCEPQANAGAPSDLADAHPLVFLSGKEPGVKATIALKLRQNGLPFAGNLNVLANRYREFVLKWNANLDAAIPQARRVISEQVMKLERLRDAKSTSFARGTSFFKKPRSASAAADAKESDDDVVEEGDSFEALIRKTRIRKLKRSREVQLEAEQLAASKRYRTAAPPCSQPTADTQINLAEPHTRPSDCQNSGTFVSAICAIDIPAVSQPCQNSSDQGQSSFNKGTNIASRPLRPSHQPDTSALLGRHRVAPPQNGYLMPTLKPATLPLNSSHPAPGTRPFFKPSSHFARPSTRPHTSANISHIGMRVAHESQLSTASQYTSAPVESTNFNVYSSQIISPTPNFTQLANSQDVNASSLAQSQPFSQMQTESLGIVNPPLYAIGSQARPKVEWSEEVKRSVERKRLIAIERKKKYNERMRLQNSQPVNSQPVHRQ